MKLAVVVMVLTIVTLSCVFGKTNDNSTITVSIVKLKFGSQVTGFILENVPDSHLSVVDLEGKKYVYPPESIAEISSSTVSLVTLNNAPFVTKKKKITLRSGESLEGYEIYEQSKERLWIVLYTGEIVSIGTSDIVTSTDTNSYISLEEYLAHEKSQTVAFILDAIPGLALGHLYTGTWVRGLTFEAAEIGIIALGAAGKLDGMGSGALFLVLTLLAIDTWQAVDASEQAFLHNERLQKKLRAEDLNLLLRYNSNDTAEIGLTLSF